MDQFLRTSWKSRPPLMFRTADFFEALPWRSQMGLLARIPRPWTRRELWEEFCDDGAFLRRHRVTPEELQIMRSIALLGEVRSKRDFLFVLGRIRRGFRG